MEQSNCLRVPFVGTSRPPPVHFRQCGSLPTLSARLCDNRGETIRRILARHRRALWG